MTLGLGVECKIPGAEGTTGGGAQVHWVEGKKPKLTEIQLKIDLKPISFFGMLVIKEKFLYSEVEVNIVNIKVTGDFFVQNSGNWFVSGAFEVTTGPGIILATIGLADLSITGGGFRIGERHSKLLVGMQVNLTNAAASAGHLMTGKVTITAFSGEALLKIGGTVVPLPQTKILGKGSTTYMQAELYIKGKDTYFSALMTQKRKVLNIYHFNYQIDLLINRKYFVLAYAGGGSGKLMKDTVSLNNSGGITFAIAFTEPVPLTDVAEYPGTRYRPPKELQAGFIIWAQSQLAIDSNKVLGPSLKNILSGGIYFDLGTAVAADLVTGKIGGGLYGIMNANLQVLGIVGISLLIGFDLGGQVYFQQGDTRAYFAGIAKVEGSVKIIIKKVKFSGTIKVEVGNPPPGMPEEPPGFSKPLIPRGNMSFLVYDIFGVPLKGIEIKVSGNDADETCITESSGRCSTKRIPLYKEYQVQATDPHSQFELIQFKTQDQKSIGSKNIKLEYPGQKNIAQMGPAPLIGNLYVQVVDENGNTYDQNSGVKVELKDIITASKSQELAFYRPKDTLDVATKTGSLPGRNNPGHWSAFHSIAADHTYRILLHAPENKYEKITIIDQVKFSELNQRIAKNGSSIPMSKYITVQLSIAKKPMLGTIRNKKGERQYNAQVTLFKNKQKVAQQSTNLYGDFNLENIPYGSYTIQVEKEPYQTLEQNINFNQNSTELQLTIGKQTQTLQIQTLDIAGKPVPNTALEIKNSNQKPIPCLDQSSNNISCTTNQQGYLYINTELEEQYNIRTKSNQQIISGQSNFRITEKTKEKTKPKTITLTIQTGPTITFTSTDQAGNPVELEAKNIQVLSDTNNQVKTKYYLYQEDKHHIYLLPNMSEKNIQIKVTKTSYNPTTYPSNKYIQVAQYTGRERKPQHIGDIALSTAKDVKTHLVGAKIKIQKHLTIEVEKAKVLNEALNTYTIQAKLKINNIKGKIPVENIEVEAKLIKGKIQTKLITKTIQIEKADTLEVSLLNLPIKIKNIEIDLEKGNIEAGATIYIQDQVPHLDCGRLEFSTDEPVLLIDQQGKPKFNLKYTGDSLYLDKEKEDKCTLHKQKFVVAKQAALTITKKDNNNHYIEIQGSLMQTMISGEVQPLGGKTFPIFYNANDNNIQLADINSQITFVKQNKHRISRVPATTRNITIKKDGIYRTINLESENLKTLQIMGNPENITLKNEYELEIHKLEVIKKSEE